MSGSASSRALREHCLDMGVVGCGATAAFSGPPVPLLPARLPLSRFSTSNRYTSFHLAEHLREARLANGSMAGRLWG